MHKLVYIQVIPIVVQNVNREVEVVKFMKRQLGKISIPGNIELTHMIKIRELCLVPAITMSLICGANIKKQEAVFFPSIISSNSTVPLFPAAVLIEYHINS